MAKHYQLTKNTIVRFIKVDIYYIMACPMGMLRIGIIHSNYTLVYRSPWIIGG